MIRRFSPEQLAAILFAFARTVVCAYRAAEQSLTVDEATTFMDYVRGPWARIYSHYDPNNHILYSILAKLSVRGFRVSEFSLRLPSLLAGFFLVLGIYWVLETAGTPRIVRWVALVVISINPLLLDLSIAARGYSLGVALLVWAIYFAMRDHYLIAGVLLGLGVSANLTIAFPAVGVIVSPLLLGNGFKSHPSVPPLRGSLMMAIPAALIAALICYPALRNAHTSQFYVGEPTLGAAILNLVWTSIRASVTRQGLFGTGAGTRLIQFWILPALIVFILAISGWAFMRDPASRRSLIPAFTLLAAAIELVAAHYAAGLNYPVDRVGIYLFLLLGLAWAIAVSRLPYMPLLAVHAALAGLLAVQFATQFEPHYFELWQFDLPAKEVARRIREECRGKAANSISVSATWYQTPALEFYRYYYRIAALKPIERHTKTFLEGFDYYVLNLKDDDDVKSGNSARLIPLYTEPISGVLLAKEPVLQQ